MTSPTFDLGQLFRAVDAERERRGLGWTALAQQVGVSSSTVRRYRTAVDAEADGVLALVRWLGVTPERFIRGGSVAGRPLPNWAGARCGSTWSGSPPRPGMLVVPRGGPGPPSSD